VTWRIRNLVSGLYVPGVQFRSSHEAWAWIAEQARPEDFTAEVVAI